MCTRKRGDVNIKFFNSVNPLKKAIQQEKKSDKHAFPRGFIKTILFLFHLLFEHVKGIVN
jgi:hypothetical protein